MKFKITINLGKYSYEDVLEGNTGNTISENKIIEIANNSCFEVTIIELDGNNKFIINKKQGG